MANTTTTFPPGYLEESRQDNIYAATSITLFFASCAVVLRFWSRHYMRTGWRLDDWLILVALISAFGLTIDFYWWMPHGFGKHIQAFGPDVAYYFPLGLFIAEMFYTGVIVFVKYSILALYWRLFSASNIKIPLVIFGFVVTAWGLSVFLLSILQCIPTEGYWDKSVHAACNVDQQKFLFGISIPNILTDVGLLVLPVPYILRLNMNTSQKRVLCSLFLLGGFVCVASILRLISVVQESSDPDLTWSFVNQIIWASVETNFAIIGACLPCLRPVWLRIRGKSSDSKSSRSSNLHSRTIGGTPAQPSKRSRHTFDRVSDDSLIGDRKLSSMDSPFKMREYPPKDLHRSCLPSQSQYEIEHPAPALHQYDRASGAGIEVVRNWTVEYQHGGGLDRSKW